MKLRAGDKRLQKTISQIKAEELRTRARTLMAATNVIQKKIIKAKRPAEGNPPIILGEELEVCCNCEVDKLLT